MNTNTIRITPEMLARLSEIDEFKGAWRALGTLAPERLSALRRIATIESIGSSTRDLLRYSEKDERHRGEYKKLPNNVGAFDVPWYLESSAKG